MHFRYFFCYFHSPPSEATRFQRPWEAVGSQRKFKKEAKRLKGSRKFGGGEYTGREPKS